MSSITQPPTLPHSAYWDKSVYDAEIAEIFRRSWLFVGLAGRFAEGEHHLTLAETSFTLTAETSGFSAGWRNGSAEIARCGTLVFVRFRPGGPSLREQLSPYFETLAIISAGLTKPDHIERVVAAANWKTLAENTLDDCHSATVHTKTLQPAMDPNWLARYQPDRHGPNSAMGNDLGAADAHFWDGVARKLPLVRHHESAIYKHYFLFPNFYVATFFGAEIVLHCIDPLGPESSALELSTCLRVTQALSPEESALHRAVIRNLTDQARLVVAEDIDVCILAQQGHHFAPHPGLLGRHETRVGDFQRALNAQTSTPSQTHAKT